MTILLLIKNILEIFIKFPSSFEKFFYAFQLIGSLSLLIIFNQFQINEYLFIDQTFLIFEIIFFLLMLIAVWFKKDAFNIERVEKLLFLFPVFLCDYKLATIFVGLYIFYSILRQFKAENLGCISIQIMTLLCLYFLFIIKIPTQALLNFTSIFLFILLSVTVYKRSAHYVITILSLVAFYSLHYLNIDFKYTFGAILFSLLVARNIFYLEFNNKFYVFKKNPIVDNLYLRLKTFFSQKEEYALLVKEEFPKEEFSKVTLEEKIYYSNTIRSSQAISFTVVFVIFILSLYFIREII